jgi:2,3-bisphosphoglycerate-independent phosphoglycerate mutase
VKFIVLLGDGMADYPLETLEGKTPLQRANIPAMDSMVQKGYLGLVSTIPPGFTPGSDVANLSVMGYDPAKYYPGRAALEAASIGVELKPHEVAFRCNLVTFASQGKKVIMEDYSAGHIETEEAKKIIDELRQKISEEKIRFFPGVSYRHLMVWSEGNDGMETTPPHDITGKEIKEYLPKGEGADLLLRLMGKSQEILKNSPTNRERIARSKKPVSSIWFWGQGRAIKMPSFEEKFGVKGGVISAVDLIKGIGITIGLKPIQVPGVTGYLDTNYRGKAEYALKALDDLDFVYVHVEAPDEAAHNGDLKAKIQAIEDFDSKVVKTVLEGIKRFNNYRVMVLPDHPTPIVKRTHTTEPVPFVIFGSEDEERKSRTDISFDESSASQSQLFVSKGHELIDYFLRRR